MKPNVELMEFVWIWNHEQGLSVPHHQRIMARWLSQIYFSKRREALLMAFRNSGKSTIVGLFCAWILTLDASQRIMVIAADKALACKMVRNIKKILERHPLTAKLIPTKKEQWAADCFTVARQTELRDPSVLARGIGGNITGSRAEIIICDDVEVPRNSDTPVKRLELRSKLKEIDFVIVPEGMQLYVGTPHTFNTIYRNKADENQEEEAFLNGFEKLKIPIINKKGESVWSERFSLERISVMRRRSGEKSFLSQMMLKPVNMVEGRLNPENLVFYEGEISMLSAGGAWELKLCGKRLVSVSCWWDPAFGASSNKGDSSVIACVFTDENGDLWLHRVRYLKVNPEDGDQSATIQCRKVAAFVKRYRLPSVRVEKNGIGRFLPGILRQEFAKAKVACSVIEESSHRNKEERILEAFDALLADKALKVHKSVFETPFVDEIREWSPSSKCRDDGLDAVAGCILSEPIRFQKYNSISIKKDWRQGVGVFKANTNFDALK